MERECKIHGLTEHAPITKNGKVSRWRCKKCTVVAVQKRRLKIKKMAVEYKGGKCQNCGYDKYYGALDFHHLDESKKEFAISQYGHSRSWERVKKELDKCIMLCSNCHREVHGGLIIISVSIENKIEIKKTINIKKCFDCGKEIDKYALRCISCSRIANRKVKNRPSKEKLMTEVKKTSYTAVGRKYNVSDNTIRRWIKDYNKINGHVAQLV